MKTLSIINSVRFLLFIAIVAVVLIFPDTCLQAQPNLKQKDLKVLPNSKISKIKNAQITAFLPDVSVHTVQASAAVRLYNGNYAIPLAVTVQNSGQSSSGSFAISFSISCTAGYNCHEMQRFGAFPVNASIISGSSISPCADVPSIAAGGQIQFFTQITLSKESYDWLSGQNNRQYLLTVYADNCPNNSPNCCVVNEQNENNNIFTQNCTL